MKLNAFFDLLVNAFFWLAIRRVEGVVAAEGASAGAYGAVAVWAAETCVDADFLHTGAELARHVRGIGVEAAGVVPREHDVIFCKDTSFLD